MSKKTDELLEQILNALVDQSIIARENKEKTESQVVSNEKVAKVATESALDGKAQTSQDKSKLMTFLTGNQKAAPSTFKKAGAIGLAAEGYNKLDETLDLNRKYNETYKTSLDQVKAHVQDLAAFGYKASKGEIAEMYKQVETMNKRRYEAGMDVEEALHRNDFFMGKIRQYTGFDLGRSIKYVSRYSQNYWDSDLGRQQFEGDLEEYQQDPQFQAMKRARSSLKMSKEVNRNNRYHDEY